MKCKDCYKEGCPHRCYTDDAECVFQQWTAKQVDWQSFRAEAAKDILCAIISQPNLGYYGDEVENAIIFADKLISKLKEEEEK